MITPFVHVGPKPEMHFVKKGRRDEILNGWKAFHAFVKNSIPELINGKKNTTKDARMGFKNVNFMNNSSFTTIF